MANVDMVLRARGKQAKAMGEAWERPGIHDCGGATPTQTCCSRGARSLADKCPGLGQLHRMV